MINLKDIILNQDQSELHSALAEYPDLANTEIPLGVNTIHPIHYVCDCVFEQKMMPQQALELVKILITKGAHVDGNESKNKKDTPLIAAASLHADDIAILLIQKGANIDHIGTHGGTALHWAAWTGASSVVGELLLHGPNLELKCSEFSATPLFWALHGFRHSGKKNKRAQIECAKRLIDAGANIATFNDEGLAALAFLDDEYYQKERKYLGLD